MSTRRHGSGLAWPFDSSLRTRDSAWMYACLFATSTLVAAAVSWLSSPVPASGLGGPASGWAFVAAWAGSLGYLSFKRRPAEVVGSGLLVVAACIPLRPVASYALSPRVATATTGGFEFLLVTGEQLLVGAMLAMVLGVLGWLLVHAGGRPS